MYVQGLKLCFAFSMAQAQGSTLRNVTLGLWPVLGSKRSSRQHGLCVWLKARKSWVPIFALPQTKLNGLRHVAEAQYYFSSLPDNIKKAICTFLAGNRRWLSHILDR